MVVYLQSLKGCLEGALLPTSGGLLSYTVLLSSAGTGASLILLAHGVENTERGLWKDSGTVEAAGRAEH